MQNLEFTPVKSKRPTTHCSLGFPLLKALTCSRTESRPQPGSHRNECSSGLLFCFSGCSPRAWRALGPSPLLPAHLLLPSHTTILAARTQTGRKCSLPASTSWLRGAFVANEGLGGGGGGAGAWGEPLMLALMLTLWWCHPCAWTVREGEKWRNNAVISHNAGPSYVSAMCVT